MKRKLPLQVNPLSSFKISYTHDHAVEALSQNLYERMHHYRPFSDIVVLCIGTDRSTGDALGPLVGTRLKKLYPPSVHILGTIDEPVHAVNLQDAIDVIKKNHPQSMVIAVDASLGHFNSVGHITVADGPLRPGAGVKKELPEVGTFHITGIVNVGGFMEYFVLQNTRLSIVMKMANTIAHSLFHSTQSFFKRDMAKSSTAYTGY